MKNLGGEDFNQLIIKYEKRNIFTLNYINTKNEEVKIDLWSEEESDFFIPSLNVKDDFKLEIKRSEY